MTVAYGNGWRAGILGWCVQRHAEYYAMHWGFGAYFESKVAAEMAAFVQRLDRSGNHLFWAYDETGPLATLSLDASDAEDGLAHIRWFIADARAKGQGIGQRLLNSALDAARHDGAEGAYLWTFRGLDAARAIYDKAGFKLVSEHTDETWGHPMQEQRFELVFGGK